MAGISIWDQTVLFAQVPICRGLYLRRRPYKGVCTNASAPQTRLLAEAAQLIASMRGCGAMEPDSEPNEPLGDSVGHGLGAAGGVEFVFEVGHVEIDHPFAAIEDSGDLPGGFALLEP